jgi:hypothetical protein
MQRWCSSEGGELNINAKTVFLRRRGIKHKFKDGASPAEGELKMKNKTGAFPAGGK